MKEKEELLNEIMERVSQISPEDQERVLEVVKAMVYTRKVVEGEKESYSDEE